jgi:hypothetical protein
MEASTEISIRRRTWQCLQLSFRAGGEPGKRGSLTQQRHGRGTRFAQSILTIVKRWALEADLAGSAGPEEAKEMFVPKLKA